MNFVFLFSLMFVVCFIEIGADPIISQLEVIGWRGALRKAVLSGDLNALKSLIEKNAEYQKYLPNMELLHHAADIESGNIDVVEYLLEIGFKLDEQDNGLGFTPLARALRSGNLEMAKLFIEKGANVNTGIRTKITPLHLSIQWGNGDIVKLLIEKGANVNAQDKNGNSALHRTAFKANINLAKILIQNGANVNIVNIQFFKHTPLHTVVIYDQQNSGKYAEFLINNGADFEAKDSLGRTPYDLAVQYGHAKIAKVLKLAEN